MNEKAVRKAVGIIGSLEKTGHHFGVGKVAVHYWCKNGVPAQHVLKLEKLSGVSRHELRPDVFGRKE